MLFQVCFYQKGLLLWLYVINFISYSNFFQKLNVHVRIKQAVTYPKTSNAANCTHQRTPLTFFAHGITFERWVITLSTEISPSKWGKLKLDQEQKLFDWLVCAGFQFSFRPPFWVMWLGSSPKVEGSESSRRDSITAWIRRYFCQFTCVFPAWKSFCTSVNIRSRSIKIKRKPSCL